MTNPNLVRKYVDDLPIETDAMSVARDAAEEMALHPVAPGVGAQLAVLGAACRANSILEVGTGTGVSGLWLLRGAPKATLTSIDLELDSQQHARSAFAAAGIPATRARLITGDARAVLPRMNEASYDIVFLDADSEHLLEFVELALTLARVGGTVAVHGALLDGRIADPAQRGEEVGDMRALLAELAATDVVVSALNPVGGGLLQITRLPDAP